MCGKTDFHSFPYANWQTGERKEVTWHCANKDCWAPKLGNHVDIVTPDNEISNYYLTFYHGEERFAILSTVNNWKGSTALEEHHHIEGQTYTSRKIFEVKKYYPLDINKDFSSQLEDIYTKIRTLLVFS